MRTAATSWHAFKTYPQNKPKYYSENTAVKYICSRLAEHLRSKRNNRAGPMRISEGKIENTGNYREMRELLVLERTATEACDDGDSGGLH